MGLYNIVGSTSMVAGQPEDISQVLANFQAIQAVLNGGIDDINIRATAAINPNKLLGFPTDPMKFLQGDGSWQRQFSCIVRNSVAISCPSGGVTTTITFDTNDYDPSNMHNVGTNNNRINIPRAGIYLVSYAAITLATVAAANYFRFRKNGTPVCDLTCAYQTAMLEYRITASTIMVCAANDYIDCAHFNNAGAGNPISHNASPGSSPMLKVSMISPG